MASKEAAVRAGRLRKGVMSRRQLAARFGREASSFLRFNFGIPFDHGLLGLLKHQFGVPGPSGFGSAATGDRVASAAAKAGVEFDQMTVLLTGCNSGIGYECARTLFAQGARVILACRTVAKGEDTAARLRARVPSAPAANAIVLPAACDLLSVAEVRRYADAVKQAGLKPTHLIADAGIWPARYMLSEDGIEATYATGFLGHFVLINALLPEMEAAAREAGKKARIVLVSSTMHKICYSRLLPHAVPGRGLTWLPASPPADLRVLPHTADTFDRTMAYSETKLAMCLLAKELSRRLKERGAPVLANACHPGTDLPHYVGRIWSGAPLYKGASKGAATPIYAAVWPDLETGGPDGTGVSGAYFEDCQIMAPHPFVEDEGLAKRLWADAEALASRPGPGAAAAAAGAAGPAAEPVELGGKTQMKRAGAAEPAGAGPVDAAVAGGRGRAPASEKSAAVGSA